MRGGLKKPRRGRMGAVSCLLVGVMAYTQLKAQGPPASPADFSPDMRDKNRLAGSQINWDNDAWVFGHTDRWYTNGTRYSWTYKINEPDSALGRMGSAIGKYALRIDATPTLTYTLGQTMYTPKDITQAAPQPYDRPWAAYWPRLVYAINLRSPEFETLGGPSTAAVQRWGSITLNWDFD